MVRIPALEAAVLLAVALVACREPGRGERGEIELAQNVTVERTPQDKIFVDFEKNWPQFVTTTPTFLRPVVRPEQPPEAPWEPLVLAECVYSADAGGNVPQVTLTWNEPVDSGPVIERVGQQVQQTPAQQPPPAQPATGDQPQQGIPDLRFDLAIHHDGLGRNYFTSALASERLERFKLPSNSPLAKDAEAVMLTGPGLFPKLMNFTSETLTNRDTAARFIRRTLVLRDLSPGLSYTIRMDRPGDDRWTEERRFVFLTPVCPG